MVLSNLIQIIIQLIENGKYLIIFLLMVLDSFNFPIPSEAVIPFGGYLASTKNLNIYLVIFISALGSLTGSLLSYFFASFILEIRKKWKILIKILPEKNIKKTHEWFEKYGTFSVFWGRMIPAVRTFISLPAGIAKMNLFKFITYTFLGSIIWSTFLAFLGFKLKENWEVIYFYFSKLEKIIIGIVIILIIYFLIKKLKNKKYFN